MKLQLDIPEFLETLVPYPPGKPLDELQREYGVTNAIKLASNENPIGPSPKAIEAIQAHLLSLHRYPDGSAYYLKKRLAELHGISQENLVIGNGSNEIIELLTRVFIRPGLEVVSSEPSFLVYKKVTQAAGGVNRIVPLKNNRHDLKAIAQAVSNSTRLIFLDNPNNPMGTVIDCKGFEAFLAALPAHVVVVLDEAYTEFVREETPSGLNYMKKDERVVVMRTFSKAYGLAGLRVGYGVMHPVLASLLDRVRQPFNVNAAAQAAAQAALDDTEHLKKTLEITWSGMAYLTDELTQMGLSVLPSQTNFLMVDMAMDAKMVYERLLRLGVIVRAMSAYGFPTYIRITAGRPEENERCIKAVKTILKG
jgi:histidinol-phosphate aminotransferase